MYQAGDEMELELTSAGEEFFSDMEEALLNQSRSEGSNKKG